MLPCEMREKIASNPGRCTAAGWRFNSRRAGESRAMAWREQCLGAKRQEVNAEMRSHMQMATSSSDSGKAVSHRRQFCGRPALRAKETVVHGGVTG